MDVDLSIAQGEARPTAAICARLTQLPFLEFLGWQVADVYRLIPSEMLTSYERGWRYRQIGNPSGSELAFIRQKV